MDGKMTLSEAGALAAILSAVSQGTIVGNMAPAGQPVLIGTARYISGLHGISGVISVTLPQNHNRDFAAEAAADVRDLFLIVRMQDGRDHAWPMRRLISRHLTGHFVTDFDLAAFEAAGGQTAVPASLTAYEAARRPAARAEPEVAADLTDEDLTRDRSGAHATLARAAGPALIRAARSWIADCEWRDSVDVAGLSDAEVYAGIAAHYTGGWPAFVRDSG